MFSSILVAVDQSEHARAAVGVAVDIARADRAALTLMTVYNSKLSWLVTMTPEGISQQTIEDIVDTTRTEAQATLDEACALVPSDIEAYALLVHGRPAEAILEEAECAGHDLVVVGSRGRGGAASLPLGSVSHHVLHHSHVEVLVVNVPSIHRRDPLGRVKWSRAAGGARDASVSPGRPVSVTRAVERPNAL